MLVAVSCAPGTPPPFDFAIPADHRFREPSRDPVEPLLRKESLTLDDALRLAERLHPELHGAALDVDLAAAAAYEARLHPNPSFAVEFQGPKERTAGLRVPLALGGRLSATGTAADRERDAAVAAFAWRRREILTDVKRAFVTALATRLALDLARDSRDLAKKVADVTDERFKAQALPEMELLKAQVSLARAELDLKTAEAAHAAAIDAMRARVGSIDLVAGRFDGELAKQFAIPSIDALRGQIAVNPLLVAAETSVLAAKAQIHAARAERIPDIEIAVLAGVDEEGDAILEGGIDVPFPLFNRNRGRILAAELATRRAALRVDAVRNDLVAQLRDAHRALSTAQERVRAYRDEILPKAGRAFSQTEEGWQKGKFGYLDVLDAQRTLAEARASHAAALLDLNLAAADLEKLTGTRLE